MSISIMVILLLVLIIGRVPIAYALIIPSLLYLAIEPETSIGMATQRLTAGANSFALLAIPMFILLGNLANASGLTMRMFDFASAALRNVRGGLGYVNVGTSVGFSLVSGAAISDAATMGRIQVPQMIERGYDKRFTLGLTAASSLIAPMVPPSIPAVIYAITAGVSVSALFVAGVFPAIVITVLLLLYVAWKTRRMPKPVEGEGQDGTSGRFVLLLKVLPALGAPLVVLGGILAGWFTPTEAAAAGVLYILLLGALYRSFTWPSIGEAFKNAASTTASIMLIVVGAGLFGWILAYEQIPQLLAESALALTENPLVFMVILNLILLLVGAVLEPTAAILIVVPVLAPMAEIYGIDPVHMGIVVIFNLMIGLLTPPVGLVLFVLSGVTGYRISEIIRSVVPFYLLMLVVLVLITFVPLLVGS
ncbi:TRAP transporter large permease [Cellulosimicrobium funkei]|nr:TRAP transporter large permease [Cellulosimicrobium funkei]